MDRDCKNCIRGTIDGCTAWDCDFISRREAIKLIKSIVRCKDCKHWEREECRLDPFWERATEPTDFCSKGVRKGE